MKPVGIGLLRDLARENGYKHVVILYDDGEEVAYTSYGMNRRECDTANVMAERAAEAAYPELEWGGKETNA